MECAELSHCFRGCRAQAFSKKSCTSLAVKPFPRQPQGKVPPFCRCSVAAMPNCDLVTCVPQGHSLAGFPPLEAIDRVGRCGFGMFVARPTRRVQDSLWEHEKLLPAARAVGVCCGGQSPGKGP